MNADRWLVGGAVFALVVAGTVVYLDAKRAAADRATIDAHERTIATLRTQSAKLDTIYLRDTLSVTKWRHSWDTVRLVARTTDTLVSVDTLRLVVAVADSTINACTQALGTCDQQKAVLRSIIAVDSGAIRALSRDLSRAKIRNRIACAVGPGWNPKGSAYISATCGVRIF